MGIIDAAKNGSLEGIRECLRQGAKVGEVDENGRTALHWAAINGHKDLISPLIEECKAEKDARDANDWTPLLASCVAGQYGAALELLRLNSDPNIDGSDGKGGKTTPLLLAASDADISVIRELVTHNADVNAKLSNLSTAMHLVSLREENVAGSLLDIIKVLVSAGARSTEDDLGYTPRVYLCNKDQSYGDQFDSLFNKTSQTFVIGHADE